MTENWIPRGRRLRAALAAVRAVRTLTPRRKDLCPPMRAANANLSQRGDEYENQRQI